MMELPISEARSTGTIGMFLSWAPIPITVLTSFYHRLMAPDIPISRAKLALNNP